MSINHVDVHSIITPPSDEEGASPQGQLRHFIRLLDAQLPDAGHPEAIVIFGAAKGRLMILRAALQCGVDALEVQKAVQDMTKEMS